MTEGQIVILDNTFANSSKVTVISQTPNKIFTKITDGHNVWSVMTNRLKPIEYETDISNSSDKQNIISS